jgi:hypothetical protein
MKRIFAILTFILSAGTCLAATGEVVLLGHFSNLKVTHDADPHFLSGYSVSLYQSGETIFGDIGIATGAPEPASGRLYDIVLDPGTRKLAFKAKYSGGRRYSKSIGPGGRESRILLVFSGTLKAKELAGTMLVQDGYSPNAPGESVRTVMKLTKRSFKPDSLEEWTQYPFPLLDC